VVGDAVSIIASGLAMLKTFGEIKAGKGAPTIIIS